MKKLPVLFASALLASSTLVLANDPAGAVQGPQAPSFNVLDVNKDGSISESEALYHGLSEKKFTVWDTNGDDMLTEAEYEKGIEEKNDVDGSTEDY
ncbi:MAG TPA: hypothetical protein VL987_00455 [Cellvibrio sp.]|nr:hypothetical protein [Cellvibrio sp.]